MSAVLRNDTGAVVAERFELLSVAGSGGMGIVWRARDRDTGETVALKLSRRGTDDEVMLERESELLAELAHPSIPRYVDHGITEDGAHYLVMEWLCGEDLGTRLERGPLSIEAALDVGGRLADALAALHAQGVVHCDIKPSNLFLIEGDPLTVKLLDLGIARRAGATHSPSQSGIIGTPFYMAPEQARGEPAQDGRMDLYSLGCILFECLTGRPPFVAASPVAVLTKVLFEDPPAMSELRAGIPSAAEAIVLRLLAKEAAARPSDAAALARGLDELRDPASSAASSWVPPVLTSNERRLVGVVLAADGAGGTASAALHLHSTLAVLARFSPPLSALREIADRHGAKLEMLADGSVAAVLAGSEAPTDLAAAAARCALALRALVPDAQVALVTGWEVFTGTQPLGRVIDRAAALLGARAGAAGHVLLDPMTAALLDERFALAGDDDAPTLVGEQEIEGEVRRLLGKPVTCLGREDEIGDLMRLFDRCVTEPAARAVLITGPPGVGKSRLRDELVRRIRAHSEAVEIWTARGDPMRQKAPFGLLGELVRRAARLYDSEPIELRRQRIAARVAHRVDASIQRRVAEFLGEMVGTPFPAEESPQLRASRLDPRLMGDQLRRAWLDFLEAECGAHPVLLVLEDLQWGDQPTVGFLDAALHALADRPLFIVAAARPEVSEVFPDLWAEQRVTPLALGELPRGACEQLVRQALGEELSAEDVSRLVARSAQNPFLLEELVRAAHEGRGDEVPETVLAMMQSRLGALAPEARRLLRAGSLLGEVFWRGAVAALLGDPPELDAALADLELHEWIERRMSPKFRGEAEYTFRHGVIRQAAYEMLTEEDRALGHRLAGEWLSQAGEMDAMVLAEHFDRGGEPARAAGHYRAAAKQALEGNDLPAALGRVERAIACGASGSELGELYLIRAEAHRWQGSFVEARQWAERALSFFPSGSEPWFSALREDLAALVDTQEHDRILRIADMLDELWSDPASVGHAQVVAGVWTAIRLYTLGLNDRAEPFHRRLEEVEEHFAHDPIAYASIAMEKAFRQGFMLVDMSVCGATLHVAAERFDRAGDLRGAYQMRVNLGHVYNELGAYRENIELLSLLLKDSSRLGLSNVAALAMSYLSKTHLALGQIMEAEIAALRAIEAFAKQGDQRMEAVSRAYLAMILGQTGAFERAEREARRALETLGSVPTLEPFARAVLAGVLLGGGRAAEAREMASCAAASADLAEEGEALIRLVHVQVQEAVGDHAGARHALEQARDRLVERAGRIASEARRRSFLENVAENARTLALSRAWLDGGPSANWRDTC